MKFLKYILYVSSIGMTLPLSALAQDNIQVAVKTVNKELTLKSDENLIIQATKSKILVKGWNKNTIHIELKLLSKHPRKEVAIEEVEYNKYNAEREKNSYVVRNYFHSADNYSSVKSNLSAEYIIYIPNQQKLEIDNSYGSISIEEATGDFKISGKFCPMHISNFSGKLSISTNYGDLQVNTFSGELTIESKKSNSLIFQSQGTCSITSEYGETLLFPDDTLDKIIIRGNKSAVKIFISDFDKYNYDLTTTHAEIELPSASLLSSVKKDGNTLHFESQEPGKPPVKIATTFNSINIRNK